MSLQENNSQDVEKSKMTYETIWRELVDLYPFISEEAESLVEQATAPEVSS